jgi:hypothetical protein
LRSRCSVPFFRCWSPLQSRCALAVHHIGRLQYRSCHRAGRSVKSRRAVCAHGARCPSLGVGRRCRAVVLSPSTSDVYNTALAIVQGDRSSRDAFMVRSWFSMPSLASGCRRRCALAVHIGRLYRSRHRARRDRSSRDALVVCAHGSRCPSLASAAPLCRSALAVHIGRLYRSRHRVKRSYKSRCVRCALMVLDALFGIRPPPPL